MGSISYVLREVFYTLQNIKHPTHKPTDHSNTKFNPSGNIFRVLTAGFHRHIPARGGLCEWRRQGTLTISFRSGTGGTFTSGLLIETEQDDKLLLKGSFLILCYSCIIFLI